MLCARSGIADVCERFTGLHIEHQGCCVEYLVAFYSLEVIINNLLHTLLEQNVDSRLYHLFGMAILFGSVQQVRCQLGKWLRLVCDFLRNSESIAKRIDYLPLVNLKKQRVSFLP